MKRARSRGSSSDPADPPQNGTSDDGRRVRDPEPGASNNDSQLDTADEDDSSHRRDIRSRYRMLISSVQREYWDWGQPCMKPCHVCSRLSPSLWVECNALLSMLLSISTENREDMLNIRDNKITEVLDEANTLFKEGMCDDASDASQCLHTVTLFSYYLVKFKIHIQYTQMQEPINTLVV